MAATGGFDIVFQFRPVVVSDILTRQLNDPLALSAQAHRLIQRYLTLEAVLPSALAWGDPTVACADHDTLLASVEISGGIRPAVLRHNVTLSATVQMPLKTAVTNDASGTPYITAEISTAEALILGNLQLGLAGLHVPVPFDGVDVHQMTAPLRPFLAQNLLQSLAGLSHTYMLGSIPARSSSKSRASDTRVMSIKRTGLRVLTSTGAEAVALALSLTDSPGTTMRITSAFANNAPGNTALVVSSEGFALLLEHARMQKRLEGTLRRSTAPGSVTWHWTSLSCAPSSNGHLLISGLLVVENQELAVNTMVVCRIMPTGILTITPSSPIDEVVLDAIRDALLRVLSTGDAGDGRLHQKFTVAESHVSVDSHCVSLLSPFGNNRRC
jgi:hypothetical protein